MSRSYRLNKTRKKKNYLKLNHPSLPPPLQINHLSPGFDFFRYINGNWLKKVHVPPYISSFGISEEIEELISKRNHQIIKDCVEISNKPNNSSMALTVLPLPMHRSPYSSVHLVAHWVQRVRSDQVRV